MNVWNGLRSSCTIGANSASSFPVSIAAIYPHDGFCFAMLLPSLHSQILTLIYASVSLAFRGIFTTGTASCRCLLPSLITLSPSVPCPIFPDAG